MIVNPMISGGVKLPALDDPGTAADLLAGKQLVDQYGKPLTGTMPKKLPLICRPAERRSRYLRDIIRSRCRRAWRRPPRPRPVFPSAPTA